MALALAAGADVLVSGDRHVLGVPAELVTVLARGRSLTGSSRRPSERITERGTVGADLRFRW